MSSTAIPNLRYADANAAIEFLCTAFDFERRMVVADQNGGVAHAQLETGTGMIMLSTHRQDQFGRLMRLPAEAGGCTQCVYVIVPDVDTHYENARKHGADIVEEPVDEDYGGRGYTCKDPEGHVWAFGSYDPWAADPD